MGAQHLGWTTASAVPLHLGHHDGALFLEFGEHLGDRRSGDAELGGDLAPGEVHPGVQETEHGHAVLLSGV